MEGGEKGSSYRAMPHYYSAASALRSSLGDPFVIIPAVSLLNEREKETKSDFAGERKMQ